MPSSDEDCMILIENDQFRSSFNQPDFDKNLTTFYPKFPQTFHIDRAPPVPSCSTACEVAAQFSECRSYNIENSGVIRLRYLCQSDVESVKVLCKDLFPVDFSLKTADRRSAHAKHRQKTIASSTPSASSSGDRSADAGTFKPMDEVIDEGAKNYPVDCKNHYWHDDATFCYNDVVTTSENGADDSDTLRRMKNCGDADDDASGSGGPNGAMVGSGASVASTSAGVPPMTTPGTAAAALLPSIHSAGGSLALTPYQKELVRSAWKRMNKKGVSGNIGSQIFRCMLDKSSDTKRLFQHVAVIEGVFSFGLAPIQSYHHHSGYFIDVIDEAVNCVDDLSELIPKCNEYGAKHVRYVVYGFKAEFWDIFGEAMISAAREWEGWKKHRETLRAWTIVVSFLVDRMRQGFETALRRQGFASHVTGSTTVEPAPLAETPQSDSEYPDNTTVIQEKQDRFSDTVTQERQDYHGECYASTATQDVAATANRNSQERHVPSVPEGRYTAAVGRDQRQEFYGSTSQQVSCTSSDIE